MSYLVLFTPLILSFLAFILPKRFWFWILKFSSVLYFFVSLMVVYLFSIWYLVDYSIFFINYSLDFTNFEYINSVFILLITVLAFLILWYSNFYFKKEIEHKTIWFYRLKEYNILVNLFIFAMLFVASTNNVLVMWIALEATTIFTTFLISFYWTTTSWEAAWKYIILCSVGLTVWLLWIIMLIVSGLNTLDFTHLIFSDVNVLLAKISFIFIIVWFWTKVWLFPMNSWLPDAHWKASTPVSAFMSSILLPLALYIIYKLKIIVDIMLWSVEFTNNILLWFWIITLIYSWFILIFQKHFKRALAYSSSENMWILALAIWIWTPMSLKLWFLHLISHSFLKSSSFMSVWNILLEQKTWKFEKISDILKNQKISAILLIFSLLMLVWVPISPLFISEIWLIFTLFEKNIFLSLIVIFAFILIFSGILINFSKLFQWNEKNYDNEKNNEKNNEKDNEKDDEGEEFEMKRIYEKFSLNSIFLPILITLILWILSIFSLLFIF